MSADRAIDEWLTEEGLDSVESRAQARRVLEQEGLTHPGKQRMSETKLAKARQVLAEHFFFSCGAPACDEAAAPSGRMPVHVSPRTQCKHCGGSDNLRAVAHLVDACRRHGVSKIVVVGGSPSVRGALSSTLGSSLQLRMIDGTERRTADRARGDVEWADLVLVWGASELHHKVSWLYTQLPPDRKRKVVHIARRGIAALLAGALEHLEGTARSR